MKVLSFGEILWDIIEGRPHLGGAPLNFAAHSAQCGAESTMISRIGRDMLGDRVLNELATLKVNGEFVQRDHSLPTGTVDVFLKEGQPSYTIHRNVAYDNITYPELAKTLGTQHFDVFYFGTLAQREKTSRETLNQILGTMDFKYRFYDVNLRKDCFSKEIVLDSLANSDILKLNDEEVRVISGFAFGKTYTMNDFMKACYERYDHEVIIVTAGGEGCFVMHGSQIANIPGRKVRVTDAVGAGDSFSAAFMYKYYHTVDPTESASVGNMVGGFVASCQGAIPAYPENIKALL